MAESTLFSGHCSYCLQNQFVSVAFSSSVSSLTILLTKATHRPGECKLPEETQCSALLDDFGGTWYCFPDIGLTTPVPHNTKYVRLPFP